MYLNIGQLTDYSKKLINAISRLERSVGSFSNVKNEKNDKFIFYNLILEGKSNAEAVATIATKSKEGIMLSFLDAQKIFKNSSANINIETIESVYESFLMNENTDSFASLQNQFIHREQLMQLLHWYSTQIEQKTLHPVLIAGIFYFNFHLINPFKKFNERMARLFTSEILKENGYSFLNILPVEKFYTENLEAYKQFFVASSEQYRQMPEWLYFFADGLADTAQQALINHSFSAFNENHVAPENLDEAKPLLVEKNGQADRASVKYINKRQTNIKVFIREKQPVKISDIAAHFEKISYNTIKKDLQLLVQYDFAQPVGNKKGTVYISKN